MNHLALDLPGEALASLGLSPTEATREICRVVAVHWYQPGRISQGTGARIAGLSRQKFLEALAEAKVPAVQITANELREDVERGLGSRCQRQAPDPQEDCKVDFCRVGRVKRGPPVLAADPMVGLVSLGPPYGIKPPGRDFAILLP